jgi:hypothetical protein
LYKSLQLVAAGTGSGTSTTIDSMKAAVTQNCGLGDFADITLTCTIVLC